MKYYLPQLGYQILLSSLLLLLFFSCGKKLQEPPLSLHKTVGNSFLLSRVFIPGQQIEAENFIAKNGVETGDCSEGTLLVGWISVGSWMDYNIYVTASSNYIISFRVAGYGGEFQLRGADGTPISTIKVPSTGGWQTWTTVKTEVMLDAGQQTLRIYATEGGWNLNWWKFIKTSNLIYENNFESRDSFPSIPTVEVNGLGNESSSSSAVTLSDIVKRSGNYSARFEFRKSDVALGVLRAELGRNDNSEQERWFGWSNYFPSSNLSDPSGEVVGQWHQDFVPGKTWDNPPLLINVSSDRYSVEVRWASTNGHLDGIKTLDLGPVTKDVWNDWVFHIKWSYQSDGIVEAWKNGVKVISYFGPNCYNEPRYPYFKIGIYKWSWEDPNLIAQSPGDTRVAYYDEVRVGNKYSSFHEVSPR